MKTTSYEISKKLVEIGFVAKTRMYWCEQRKEQKIFTPTEVEKHNYMMRRLYKNGYDDPENRIHISFPAYDLDTILETLPKELKNYGELGSLFRSDTFILGYNMQDFENLGQLLQYKMQGDSLADTAARLLILLHNKGIIKFRGEDEKETTK